ncbi:MAG TPA: spore germination protein GerW family protein [Solirubrobacterales bacterium]
MDVQELLAEARDSMTARRVYGEPYEGDGVTVIPAAVVRGGSGGGSGRSEDGEGGGGGFGLTARPVGAWIITDQGVTWKPAPDVNRIVLGGQLVGLAAVLMLGRILLARARRA